MVPPHFKSQPPDGLVTILMSELESLVPAYTEGYTASLRGGHWEGLSKEWAFLILETVHSSWCLALIVLHHKIPQMKYSSGHIHP